jgi:hypothetical protein
VREELIQAREALIEAREEVIQARRSDSGVRSSEINSGLIIYYYLIICTPGWE